MRNIISKSIIIGIDTHKATHVAVAIDRQGARLAALSVPANTKGYLEFECWSRSLGDVAAFGIEGTGSYGAGLSRSLLKQGHKVVEVTRPHRQLRCQQGKPDSLDAEGAARSVLNGQATATPKTQTGYSEMIRHMKIARDTAVKCRSQAMVTLKTPIINAPAELRDMLDQNKGKVALIRHIAALSAWSLLVLTANNQQLYTPAAHRRTVRRVTPATLTGVSGRPTLACADEIRPRAPGTDRRSLNPAPAIPNSAANSTRPIFLNEVMIILLSRN